MTYWTKKIARRGTAALAGLMAVSVLGIAPVTQAANLTIESFRLSETVATNKYTSIKQQLVNSRLEWLRLASDNKFDNILFSIVLDWTHHSRGPAVDAWIF